MWSQFLSDHRPQLTQAKHLNVDFTRPEHIVAKVCSALKKCQHEVSFYQHLLPSSRFSWTNSNLCIFSCSFICFYLSCDVCSSSLKWCIWLKLEGFEKLKNKPYILFLGTIVKRHLAIFVSLTIAAMSCCSLQSISHFLYKSIKVWLWVMPTLTDTVCFKYWCKNLFIRYLSDIVDIFFMRLAKATACLCFFLHSCIWSLGPIGKDERGTGY